MNNSRILIAALIDGWLEAYAKLVPAPATSDKPARREWMLSQIATWNELRNASDYLTDWAVANTERIDPTALCELAATPGELVLLDRHYELAGKALIAVKLLRSLLGTTEQAKADLIIERICPPASDVGEQPGTVRLKPLTQQQQDAFDLIARDGPLFGKEIARQLDISESTFTRHFVPSLKAHGIENRRGLGYYHPARYRPER